MYENYTGVPHKPCIIMKNNAESTRPRSLDSESVSKTPSKTEKSKNLTALYKNVSIVFFSCILI